MKRFLLLLIAVILLVGSCKKTEVIPNQTIIENLSSGQWIPLNGGKSYTAAINIPELDDYMNERGGVLVYISFGSKTYEQIPQVYNGESYSYVTRPGQVVLEVQRYDGQTVILPPGNMTVKIILMASAY